MQTNRLTLPALIGCALLTVSCATSVPESAPPPRLTLPSAATEPCELPVLPFIASEADLEAAYTARGAALASCDAARELAVQTLLAERALYDRWRAMTPPSRRPSWWPL